MKKVILLFLVAALAWKGYQRYSERHRHPDIAAPEIVANVPLQDVVQAESERFTCDGRTYCSQMKSCEEATYFLQHCPNAKMDGNNDGIPCEKQWCN